MITSSGDEEPFAAGPTQSRSEKDHPHEAEGRLEGNPTVKEGDREPSNSLRAQSVLGLQQAPPRDPTKRPSARRWATIGATWRSPGVAPGALATVGAADAPILEWRRAVLTAVLPHTPP